MPSPLSHIKVVEISVAMAGPFCGMMLADCGADVVKIERVGQGDDSRAWPPHYASLSAANPRLIYCSISGFGASGPRRGDPANDLCSCRRSAAAGQ